MLCPQRSQKWAPFINIRSCSVFSRVVLCLQSFCREAYANQTSLFDQITYFHIGYSVLPKREACTLYRVMPKTEDIAAVENMLGELEAKGLEVDSIVNELDLCKLSKMEWFGRLEQCINLRS